MVSAISNFSISNNALLAGAFGLGVTPEITSIRQAQSSDAQKTQSSGQEPTTTSTDGDTGDTVEISDAAKALVASLELSGATQKADQQSQAGSTSLNQDQQSVGNKAASSSQLGSQKLSDQEKKQVQKLRQRDTEVRTHEQAHASAAGGNARGGAKLEFKTGPDGRQYAVSGEVSIDTSAVSGNPQATITKMQQVRRAALAPAQPSGQDRSVAAQAQVSEREARAELSQQRQSDLGGSQATKTQQPQSINGQAKSTSQSSTNSTNPNSISSANPNIVAVANLAYDVNSKTPSAPTVGFILDIAG